MREERGCSADRRRGGRALCKARQMRKQVKGSRATEATDEHKPNRTAEEPRVTLQLPLLEFQRC